MPVRVYSIENDGDVREELGDDIEDACATSKISFVVLCSEVEEKEVPQIRQSMNSMPASGSCTRSSPMAIADWPIMIVPIWCKMAIGDNLIR